MKQRVPGARIAGLAGIALLLGLPSCGGSGGGGPLPDPMNINLASSGPTPLPDGAVPGAEYPSEIVVSTPGSRINSISIVVLLTHERAQDLDLLLVGPTGVKVMLMSDCLGDYSLGGDYMSFGHASSTPVPTGTQAPPGVGFQPTDNDPGGDPDVFYAPAPAGPYSLDLADFIGTDPNGVWRLYVYDDTLNGTAPGELGAWQIWLVVL